jgi:hypothetical protein
MKVKVLSVLVKDSQPLQTYQGFGLNPLANIHGFSGKIILTYILMYIGYRQRP